MVQRNLQVLKNIDVEAVFNGGNDQGDGIGAVAFQASGNQVGGIAHFGGSREDLLPDGLTDAARFIKGTGYSRNGNTTIPGYIF